jgi:HlyD family secretion protein
MTTSRPQTGDEQPVAQIVQLPTKRQPAFVSEFQPDAVEVEERSPPRVARLTLYLLMLFITTALAWACLTEVDEIAVARGKLITVEPNIVVQPLESSVIRRIEVNVGQSVTFGQTLAVLDPTFTEADVHQLRVKFNAADAMVNRLEAELSNRVYFPSESSSPEYAIEARLAAQRAVYRTSRLQNFTNEIARVEASMEKNRQEEKILRERLAGIKEVEQMRATLLAHETGSKLNLLQARDVRLDIEANLARLEGVRVEAGHEREKALVQRQEFLEDFRRTTLEALVEARERRNSASEELKKAELRQRHVTLTAPAEAVVLEIAQRSIGSVVRQAEPLFVLVPQNVPMEAEVLLEPEDIGHISQNQTARIKLDAFPFQKHGTATGTVRMISQDSFPADPRENRVRPSDRLFYRARLSLVDIKLRDVPPGFRLLPGMALQAEIQVGRRRVVSYFLYPLLRGFDESIREK